MPKQCVDQIYGLYLDGGNVDSDLEKKAREFFLNAKNKNKDKIDMYRAHVENLCSRAMISYPIETLGGESLAVLLPSFIDAERVNSFLRITSAFLIGYKYGVTASFFGKRYPKHIADMLNIIGGGVNQNERRSDICNGFINAIALAHYSSNIFRSEATQKLYNFLLEISKKQHQAIAIINGENVFGYN